MRWYALAYILGLVLAWRYARWMTARAPGGYAVEEIDDFLFWTTLGVVLGGRCGYIFFYKPGYYLAHPLEIFFLWQGGMSFHGGLLGVTTALALFAWQRGKSWLRLADLAAAAAPIGLFLGRLANFVNGELFGRPSTVAWAMVFPGGGPLPRHPSQLYQAALEGSLLFVLLHLAVRLRGLERPGLVAGLFLVGYGSARVVGEFFREPDAFIGFLPGGLTMGQALSLPMILAGLALTAWSGRALERA